MSNKIKILIDSREQKPLDFEDHKEIIVENVCLPYGDYRAEFKNGYRPPIVFERKNLSDLFGTLGAGYTRFKKEVCRARTDKVRLIIIIEGSLTKVLRGIKYGHRDGKSIVRQLFTLMVRSGIPFVCCSNRKEMAQYIVSFYTSCDTSKYER